MLRKKSLCLKHQATPVRAQGFNGLGGLHKAQDKNLKKYCKIIKTKINNS